MYKIRYLIFFQDLRMFLSIKKFKKNEVISYTERNIQEHCSWIENIRS